MDITVYNDLVHPMIFNPHEYILGLSQVPSEQIVDTLTDLILRRYEKY